MGNKQKFEISKIVHFFKIQTEMKISKQKFSLVSFQKFPLKNGNISSKTFSRGKNLAFDETPFLVGKCWVANITDVEPLE